MGALNFRFVEKYIELQKQGEIDDDKLFEETGKALLAEGLLLRRKVTENVSIPKSCSKGEAGAVKFFNGLWGLSV